MIRPVILSGGGGTRLWPLSRSGNPKQFQRIVGDQSLLQATAKRCSGPLFHSPLISTGEGQRPHVVDQLEAIGVAPVAILLEPVARNTAPAIAAAAHWALARGEDDPLLVTPSDHLIKDVEAMQAAIEAALPAALEGNLLTFGIRPASAHTGYGYIQAGEGGGAVRPVERFVEKPDAETAERFVAHGSYYWNSGIFLFRPSAFLAELVRHAPDVAEAVEKAMAGASVDELLVRPDVEAFAAVRDISIDYAVMEHSDKVLVVPVTFAWSDVGSWDAVRELMPADESGNVLQGDVLALDVTNSLIRSDSDVTVAVVGLDRVVCVVTDDAVFVAPLDRAQDVKKVVDRLKAARRHEAVAHNRVYRPWGFFESLIQGERFQVKRIVVSPGGKLSLQKHFHRAEHWVVVNGTAVVQRDAETHLLRENESIYLPLGCVHRLENPGMIPLTLIEVQSGAYLGEDDIVRIEDTYGRA
jgi:mannose-1-phosphate guanylyltransferase/mannose-6-phosphate isomerase